MSDAVISITEISTNGATLLVAPTPEQIDELAERHIAADKACEDAKKALAKVKAEGIALVAMFGSVPPKTEASRCLEGRFHTLTVTEGTTTTIKEPNVLRLRAVLAANKFGPIFDNLFRPRTRWEMVKGGYAAILTAAMPKRLTETVERVYARCFSSEKKAPSLTVKKVVEKPAKKTRAKKGGE